MLSIGTIEILLAAGLVSILALTVVVLHGAAVRYMQRHQEVAGDPENAHLEQRDLARNEKAKVGHSAASRDARQRRDRAA